MSPIVLEPTPEREVVDAAKAESMIASWKEQLQSYRSSNPDASVLCEKIVLTNKSYTREAAKVIADFLTGTDEFNPSIASGIKYAQLDDIIASRMEDEGLEVLTTISNAFQDSKLIEVDLSDNAMGSKGVTACEMVIGGNAVQNSMEALKLCNNGLSEYTMEEVADLLTKEIENGSCIAEKLRLIHFFNNMSGNAGCESFAKIMAKCSDKLEDVRMSGTRARAEGSAHITSSLAALAADDKLGNIQRLDLADNSFGDCAEDLATTLKGCPKLTYLNLNDCMLADEGIEMICDALIESKAPVEYLNLGGNEITKDGAKNVAKLIRAKNSTLVTFMANENEMTSIGIRTIAKAFKSSTVKTVTFNFNEVGTIGADALIAMKGRLSSLEKVEIDGNMIPEDAVERLTDAFGDILVELEENDDEEDADDDLDSDDLEEDSEDEAVDAAQDAAVDDLANALGNVTV